MEQIEMTDDAPPTRELNSINTEGVEYIYAIAKEEIIEELIKINFPIEYLDKAIEYLNSI